MSRYDFTSHRLFLDAPLHAGAEIALNKDQANYLLNVLRLPEAAGVLVFNGRDGEWRAQLSIASKKAARLIATEKTRGQDRPADIELLFAPLKHARLDYMVQKAVEMGVCAIRPVITRRTQASRVNLERMRANVIEAAEQCGVLSLPKVHAEVPLRQVLDEWPQKNRTLIFCDEDAAPGGPLAALETLRRGGSVPPLSLVIGPEGGFDPEERAQFLLLSNVLRLSLGPRILRADTAAVAALALVQACLGDWR
ncbi:16S rRNA (uracil(1498)-N(3))-methyltransferase [Methylovirgula sp. 4M-Z18]|uniref:16S rRNA (uracil(1498)-N(3))-methyltransferase n=1 Tax=Methylovirgula sp. 4M-Z18 TaxID=2293567 RepID=UPI000E2E94E7|nr:16S rRNA (uracil(1498)-N(3))-methyltransferase [Methylovirgula sp. 4M-Z18]RFB78839.1 16S rRNA (uracil(1498)-N(3))-methyltransferase [Methylovirgula sp. 4M-Z18]